MIHEMQFEGKNNLTFGASAEEDLDIEYNLGGWKIRMLGKAYRKIVSKYGLANRGQFRVSRDRNLSVELSTDSDGSFSRIQAKFGTEEEPLHIAYPQNSFGLKGLVALMHMMRA